MRYGYLMLAAALCAGTVHAADTLDPAAAAGQAPATTNLMAPTGGMTPPMGLPKLPPMCIFKMKAGNEATLPCDMDGMKKLREATDADMKKLMPPMPPAPPAGLAGAPAGIPPAMGLSPTGAPMGAPVGLPAGIPPAKPLEVTPAN